MEPFLGQIMQAGFSYAPRGWMLCQGQIMSIAQNTALYSLLGVSFGGDGRNTFGIPDARGRVLAGTGTGPGLQPVQLGEVAGTPATTLTIANMPAHNHSATFTPSGGSLSGQLQAKASVPAAQLSGVPTDNCFLANTSDPEVGGTPLIYAPASAGGTPVNMGGVSVSGSSGGSVVVGITGNNMPVPIMQPYLGMTTLIAVEGIFPPRQ